MSPRYRCLLGLMLVGSAIVGVCVGIGYCGYPVLWIMPGTALILAGLMIAVDAFVC